ncbi:MAG: hypothetical protein Q8R04_05290, partial [Nanoarchaeota archaeon]|nr:hypothetical protein [Nanoarchaeota archaeon]
MHAKNPEKECKKTPEHFSTTSKIVSMEKEDFRRGVIFDTPEEFGQALIAYDSGRVPKSVETERQTAQGISESQGGLA